MYIDTTLKPSNIICTSCIYCICFDRNKHSNIYDFESINGTDDIVRVYHCTCEKVTSGRVIVEYYDGTIKSVGGCQYHYKQKYELKPFQLF